MISHSMWIPRLTAVSKTMNGKPVKAMEHPGLWNEMAFGIRCLYLYHPPCLPRLRKSMICCAKRIKIKINSIIFDPSQRGAQAG